jgi:hypothetical protein
MAISRQKGQFLAGLLIASGVLTLGYMGVNQYRANHPPEPQPLSTQGLPVPETDVPVTLPPDPGEAGKLTLEGIDSNNDGVRDDLEREIVYMFPQNEEVRRVLRAMVKAEQQIITTEGDHEYFKGLTESFFAFKHCYEFLVFRSKSQITDFTNGHVLWNMLLNTPERKQKEDEHDYIARPYTAPIYGTQEDCSQPLIQGKY